MEAYVDEISSYCLQVGVALGGIGYAPGYMVFFEGGKGCVGQPALIPRLERELETSRQEARECIKNFALKTKAGGQLNEDGPLLFLEWCKGSEESGQGFFSLLEPFEMRNEPVGLD